MTDEKLLRVWERRRKRGFWHFALLRGAVPGITCAVTVYSSLTMDAGWRWRLGIIVVMVLYAVFKMTSISFKWRDYEARYRRLTENAARSAFE